MTKCDAADCWAHIDWHCEHSGVVRVFAGDHQFGEPYCYALPFKVIERFAKAEPNGQRGIIEFVGMTQVAKPCQYRAGVDAILHAGFAVIITRMRGGVRQSVELRKRYWER